MSTKTTGNFLMRNLLAIQAQDSSPSYSDCTGQQQLARCQLLLSEFLSSHLNGSRQNQQHEQTNCSTISNEDNCLRLVTIATPPEDAHRASTISQLGRCAASSSPEVIDLSVEKCRNHDQCQLVESTNEAIGQGNKCKALNDAVAETQVGNTTSSNVNNETRTRRTRTMFSEWQLSELEWRFDRNKYLITSDRRRIAKLLELDQIQVKTWFQNRRMKWKKQILASGIGVKSPTKPKGRPKRDSIPPIDDD